MEIKKYHTGPILVNTYLVFDETGCGFILDPGGYKDTLMRDIEENEITPEYIVLTHGHGDHIGGIREISEAFPGIKVVAHRDEREMLMDPYKNSSLDICGTAITLEADIYVEDGDHLKVGNMDLSFIHTPGHTVGGMCILVEKMLFSGDTLFQGSIGRTDFYKGDFHALIKSIREKLYILPDDTVVLPGHMGDTTIGYEKRYNPFVQG